MPLRPPAGFISAFYDPLKVADAPTIGTATSGDASATVPFTAPTNTGGAAITQYYAVSNPDQITGNAASSPVTVSGLTNGTSYTFTVWALNSYGPSPYSAASNSVSPAAIRGLFGGGLNISDIVSNIIDYVTISSTGNATDFGDLTVARRSLAGCSSLTRGVFGGGNSSNVMDYVTISTTGNATDFGDIGGYGSNSVSDVSACSNSTRGIWFGGGSPAVNTISYITIASTGNASSFGELTVNVNAAAGCSSSTRGLNGGGRQGTPINAPINVIDYVTISSTGNATDFGDLYPKGRAIMACSSSTRGVWAGGDNDGTQGFTALNVIQYITIASLGNSSDFGDLPTSVVYGAGCSSSTRGLFGGASASASNVINYITIASTGNATDFGDLTAARGYLAACSNGHGGL